MHRHQGKGALWPTMPDGGRARGSSVSGGLEKPRCGLVYRPDWVSNVGASSVRVPSPESVPDYGNPTRAR